HTSKELDDAQKTQINAFLDFLEEHYLIIFNEWLGFKQTKFTKKGKYYSRRPLPFYVTELFLRTNLVDTTETFFNNTPSNILSIIPVDDGDQVKLQRYDLLLSKFKCIKEVNKCTNHIKFELTDDKGKIVNLRGTPISLELELELNPCINLIDNS
ncbi:hypothetical protein, partial [Bartonella sp. CL32QHWL-2]|uniref:hypothetical protein n=1 Tax=Bartonella sp. CL32QHWL-2 TaxID=3243525 RepID=UPI0035CEC104